jgi:hypothetical protein
MVIDSRSLQFVEDACNDNAEQLTGIESETACQILASQGIGNIFAPYRGYSATLKLNLQWLYATCLNTLRFKSNLLHHNWEAFGNTAHPIVGVVPCRFGGDHSSALYMHEYKCGVSFEPARCEHFLGEEIARPQGCRMPFEKLVPFRFRAIWSGLDVMLFKDRSGRRSRDRHDPELA